MRAGLVVSPGFIDLHTHVNDAATYRLAAQQGVTTALDLEIGAPDVAAFLRRAARHGRRSISARRRAIRGRGCARSAATAPGRGDRARPVSAAPKRSPATPSGTAIRARLEHEIDAGALGIGMGLVYTPGATRAEAIDVFRVAAARRVPVFVHVRSSGRLEPGSSIESVGEVIAASAVTGAPRAHRPHQQQLHGRCARVPADDRRRARARARRHRRGLSRTAPA